MGHCFAEFDWAANPLGETTTWSSEVRAAVATALTSRFPIVLWLGHADLSVEGFLREETVSVAVSDTGRWLGDSSASLRTRRRGRGLTLMSGLADRVDTVRSEAGTQVTLEFDLTG